ncbi:hypothetical protein BC835DRAFT_1301814 [Cytidiella melzeri]|nr:hypothetical protein BC835DRAFT_1301814 [Cytidiella melzeri]
MTASDYNLCIKLDNFCRQKMQDMFGWAALRNLGPTEVMSDEVLKRIASCARCNKIASLEDVQREVPKWQRARELSQEILVILQSHYLLTNLYATTPLRQRPSNLPAPANSTADVAATVRKVVTCSACKQHGHTRELQCIYVYRGLFT